MLNKHLFTIRSMVANSQRQTQSSQRQRVGWGFLLPHHPTAAMRSMLFATFIVLLHAFPLVHAWEPASCGQGKISVKMTFSKKRFRAGGQCKCVADRCTGKIFNNSINVGSGAPSVSEDACSKHCCANCYDTEYNSWDMPITHGRRSRRSQWFDKLDKSHLLHVSLAPGNRNGFVFFFQPLSFFQVSFHCEPFGHSCSWHNLVFQVISFVYGGI